jgi:endonuclease YncB( thermonuclease family)
MARKNPKSPKLKQSQINNVLFALLIVVVAVWLLSDYLNSPTTNEVRGTAIPLPTESKTVLVEATVTRAVRGTPIPATTEAGNSNPSPTATTPIRGTPIPAPAANTPAMPETVEEGIVMDVVDGDTLDIRIGNRVERVRMIGLNTPESVDPRRPVQCFGVEASTFNKSLTLDQSVYLEIDPTQGDRDQFNRLLRYVWLPDGRMVNLELIANGYAAQYTFDTPYKYRDLFRAAERAAEESDAGLWSPTTCNGDFNAPADFGGAGTAGVGCPDGCIQPPTECTIKGNVNAAGRRIYHVDGQSDAYNGVNMNPGEGDRWFCTIEEAEAAGFISAP